jgi:DNA-binding transcriptional LysR family regulator
MADDLDREVVTQGNLRTGRVAVGGGPFPAESFLGPAAARFTEEYPRVSVQLHSRDWDELLRGLRSRELDFFVAESSTLQKEPDLEIVPLPAAHSLHFVARSGHPLSARDHIGAADVFRWPFVAPARIPPRVLDPALAAHRDATQRGLVSRPFPSIQCSGLGPVKRILATSDAVTASLLSCVAVELESGQFVLLGTEPWLHLHYGIVSLKGRPWTRSAETFRQFVLEAERAATLEEQQLIARFGKGLSGPPEPPARPRARKRPSR